MVRSPDRCDFSDLPRLLGQQCLCCCGLKQPHVCQETLLIDHLGCLWSFPHLSHVLLVSPVIHFSLWEEMFLDIWNFYSLLLLKTHHKGRLIERLFVCQCSKPYKTFMNENQRGGTKSRFMEIRQSYFCMWCVSQSCSLFTRVQISWSVKPSYRKKLQANSKRPIMHHYKLCENVQSHWPDVSGVGATEVNTRRRCWRLLENLENKPSFHG